MKGSGSLEVQYRIEQDSIVFLLKCDEEEESELTKFSGKQNFKFEYEDIGRNAPHPDKIALVGILCALPFAKGELRIGWGISRRFSEECKRITKTVVHSKHEFVEEEAKTSEKNKHCLSYSGGADSTAALAVMPKTTECVFLLRTRSKKKSLYDSDAALNSCRKLKLLGYKVHIVKTDLEYLRNPVGFPTDLAVACPSILLSGMRKYASIAFGTIMESAYGTGGKAYRDYLQSSHFLLYSNLFAAANIGYSLPVAGVSEVGSTMICERHGLGVVNQSCIRGKWSKPCDRCWKCFRKQSVLAAIRNYPEEFDYISRIKNSKEVWARVLQDKPIKHEGVLTYSLQNSNYHQNLEMKLFSKLLRVTECDTRWMEKWYSGSSNLIHDYYRNEVIDNLSRILGRMDKEQQEQFQGWRNEDSADREEILSQLISLLESGK